MRRSSRREAFLTVLENQDLEGRGAGGGALVWLVRVVWKVVKSE